MHNQNIKITKRFLQQQQQQIQWILGAPSMHKHQCHKGGLKNALEKDTDGQEAWLMMRLEVPQSALTSFQWSCGT